MILTTAYMIHGSHPCLRRDLWSYPPAAIMMGIEDVAMGVRKAPMQAWATRSTAAMGLQPSFEQARITSGRTILPVAPLFINCVMI